VIEWTSRTFSNFKLISSNFTTMLFVPCGVTSDRYMFTVIQQKLSCNTCRISSIPVCSVESKLSEFTGHVLEVQCPNPRCRGTFSADADNSDLALCISLLSADAARNTSCYELVMNRSRNAVRLIF